MAKKDEKQEEVQLSEKEQAEQILAKYSGINGSINEPEELTKAKEILKKK